MEIAEAEPPDGCDAMQADESMPEKLSTWSDQEGFPVVTVALKATGQGRQRVALSQRRFFKYPDPNGGSATSGAHGKAC